MTSAMPDKLRINEPHDGDVLNRHDGRIQDDRLHLPVSGAALKGGEVTVNGVGAHVSDGWFCAEIELPGGPQIITARLQLGGLSIEQRIGVTVDLNSTKRYRFSVDDTIEFLVDIGRGPDAYGSLFDHWFLAFWRDIHREWGTKVHINIYYQNEARDFNLTMFPDKYKDEWESNADWLHLSFHALQNYPNRIYQHAGYDLMATHFEMVMEQVRRFAGEAVTGHVTTVHWAEAPVEAVRALRDRGVDTFIALPRRHGGECNTIYYLDEERGAHLGARDAWQDTAEDVTFITCDQVVNSKAVDEVVPHLEQQAADPHTGEMIELLIHEQYFRRDLLYYQHDAMEKVRRAVSFVTEHGYAPVFWCDGFLGSPL